MRIKFYSLHGVVRNFYSFFLTCFLLFVCVLNAGCLVRNIENADDIYFRNRGLQLRFSPIDFSLKEIRNRPSAISLIAPINDIERNLWEIEFIDESGKVRSVSSLEGGSKHWDFYSDGEKEVLELQWKKVPIVKGGDQVDVKVKLVSGRSSSLSKWWISIENRGDSYGLWKVHFPIIGGIGFQMKDGKNLKIAIPFRTGWEFSGLEELPYNEIEWEYPSAMHTMQFSCFYSGDSGFYFACHDSNASHKVFRYVKNSGEAGLRYEVIHHPSDMGEIGNNYELPYPVIIGAYQGDWYEGSRIYRNWATKQVWCSRGKIAYRQDLPEWYKNLSLWYKGRGGPDKVSSLSLSLRETTQVPLAVHWYWWHMIPFDDDYPNYFPPKQGFKASVGKLQDGGVFVFPYVNGRLWDKDGKNWSQGSKAAAKDRNMNHYIEVYKSGEELAPMCPSSRIWQDKMYEIVSELAIKYRVNGVYLDQVGAARPKLCFDTSHGHPVGGGSFWFDGYRDLLSRMEKITGPQGNLILTTESNAEPWIDLIDGYLTHLPTLGNTVPMFQTVYGDYAVTFGKRVLKGDLDNVASFYAKESEIFVHGGAVGWLDNVIMRKGYEDQRAYLGYLAERRTCARKYLVEGELLKPFEIKNKIETTVFEEDNFGQKWRIIWPSVRHSVWKAVDGTVGIVLVNTLNRNVTVNYNLDMEEYGFNKDASFSINTLCDSANEKSYYVSSDIERTDILSPQGVIILQIVEEE